MVAIYCRVSSVLQAEHGNIQAQVDYAEKYCDLNQLKYKFYLDDGVSGAVPLEERPAGAQLLADARQNIFDAIYVYKIDRLGRSTRIILNSIHFFESLGIAVKSMTEPFDTSNPSGRFMLTMLAGVADLERSNITERMMLGRHRAAQKGKYPQGRAPYGYTLDKDGILHIKDDEVPIIKRIYDDYLTGTIGMQKLADRLNAEGVATRNGGRWGKQHIQIILTRTIYAGTADTAFGEFTCPAIVPPELQVQAAEVIERNSAFAKRNNTRVDYLLRGMVICGRCGHTFMGRSTSHAPTGKKSYYYVCGRRHANSRWPAEEQCHNVIYRKDTLEEFAWLETVHHIKYLATGMNRNKKQVAEAKIIDRRPQLEKEIKKCDTEKERLLNLYRLNIVSMADLQKQLDDIASTKSNLEKQVKELSKKVSLPPVDVEYYIRHAKKLSGQMDDDLPFERKEQIVRLFINSITVDGTDCKLNFVL